MWGDRDDFMYAEDYQQRRVRRMMAPLNTFALPAHRGQRAPARLGSASPPSWQAAPWRYMAGPNHQPTLSWAFPPADPTTVFGRSHGASRARTGGGQGVQRWETDFATRRGTPEGSHARRPRSLPPPGQRVAVQADSAPNRQAGRAQDRTSPGRRWAAAPFDSAASRQAGRAPDRRNSGRQRAAAPVAPASNGQTGPARDLPARGRQQARVHFDSTANKEVARARALPAPRW